MKRHQRFVEFYDVRDAAKALSEMNGKEVSGTAMVIEFSRPGGGHHKKFSKPTIRYNNKFNSPANYTTLQTPPPFCRSGVIVSPPQPRSQSLTRKSSFGIENPNGRHPIIINSGGGAQNSSGNLKEDDSSLSKSRNSKKNARGANNNSSSTTTSSKGRHWKGSKAAAAAAAAKEYDPRFLINEDAIINETNKRDPRTTVMIKNIPNKYRLVCAVHV